jgi:hypothetical protein
VASILPMVMLLRQNAPRGTCACTHSAPLHSCVRLPAQFLIGGVSCSMCRHCGATACEHSRRGLIALLLAFWGLAIQMSSAANSASSSSLARAATGSRRNALQHVHSGRVKLQLKNSRAASGAAASSQRVQSLALDKGPHKAAPTTTTSKSNLYTLLSGGLAGSISR